MPIKKSGGKAVSEAQFLSVKEVAQRFDVDVQTVYTWGEKGWIKPVDMSDEGSRYRRWKIPAKEVDRVAHNKAAGLPLWFGLKRRPKMKMLEKSLVGS